MNTAGNDSTPCTSQPLSRPRRWWLVVVTVVILLSAAGYAYRRQVFVWFALDAGGAALDWSMIPQALNARESLLDEQLAACRAKSDLEAVQFLKKLLTGSKNPVHTELDQLYAMRRLLELPKEQQAMVVPELVGLLEKSFGTLALNASDMLSSLGPLAEGETGRLLRLASSGDPVWKRMKALSILASFKSESPEVIGVLTRAAAEDPDEHSIRAHAQVLLYAQTPAVKVMAAKDLLVSKFSDARLIALQMLESAAADSLKADALNATQDPSGQVRIQALFTLRRVAPTQAIEAANVLRHDSDVFVRAAAIGTLLKSSQPLDQADVDNMLSSLHNGFSNPIMGAEERLRYLYTAADLAPEQAVAWAEDALKTIKKEASFTDYHRKLLQDFIAKREKEH